MCNSIKKRNMEQWSREPHGVQVPVPGLGQSENEHRLGEEFMESSPAGWNWEFLWKAGHEPGMCVCTPKAKQHPDSAPL